MNRVGEVGWHLGIAGERHIQPHQGALARPKDIRRDGGVAQRACPVQADAVQRQQWTVPVGDGQRLQRHIATQRVGELQLVRQVRPPVGRGNRDWFGQRGADQRVSIGGRPGRRASAPGPRSRPSPAGPPPAR